MYWSATKRSTSRVSNWPGCRVRHHAARRSPELQAQGVIDQDWLHEQYVVCGRTLPDLAREKNMSTTKTRPCAPPAGRSTFQARSPRGDEPVCVAAAEPVRCRHRLSDSARGRRASWHRAADAHQPDRTPRARHRRASARTRRTRATHAADAARRAGSRRPSTIQPACWIVLLSVRRARAPRPHPGAAQEPARAAAATHAPGHHRRPCGRGWQAAG